MVLNKYMLQGFQTFQPRGLIKTGNLATVNISNNVSWVFNLLKYFGKQQFSGRGKYIAMCHV